MRSIVPRSISRKGPYVATPALATTNSRPPAAAMNDSTAAATVHEMIGRLERDGYVTRDADKAIQFTGRGRGDAEEIVSRHRLIERFLTDVVGVPWDDVHEEAERLEHAMSPRFEAYVRASV